MRAIRTILLAALCVWGAPAWAASQPFPIANFPDDSSDSGLVLSGDIAVPSGAGPFPAIVLLHGCGGYSGRFRRDWPAYLNELGYLTFTIDSFGPRGFRKCNRELFGIRNTDRGQRDRYLARDAYGALDFLATVPIVDKRRVAVMGFSFGAITVNYLAGRQLRDPGARDFRAAIGFYGHCYRLAAPANMTPLLLLIGSEDKWLRDDPRGPGCELFAGSGKVELRVFKGAHHGFDNPRFKSLRTDIGGNTMQYSAEATQQARAFVKDFLARLLR
jgi:dienelactone hydrolase